MPKANKGRSTTEGRQVSGLVDEFDEERQGWSIVFPMGGTALLPAKIATGAGYRRERIKSGAPIDCVVSKTMPPEVIRIRSLAMS